MQMNSDANTAFFMNRVMILREQCMVAKRPMKKRTMSAELVPLFARWDLKSWYLNRHEQECLSRVCELTKNLECVQPPCSSFLTNSWCDLHSQQTHTSKTSPFKPCSQRPPWNPRRSGPQPDCPGNSAHLWVERLCPLCEIEKFPGADISWRQSYLILLKR